MHVAVRPPGSGRNGSQSTGKGTSGASLAGRLAGWQAGHRAGWVPGHALTGPARRADLVLFPASVTAATAATGRPLFDCRGWAGLAKESAKPGRGGEAVGSRRRRRQHWRVGWFGSVFGSLRRAGPWQGLAEPAASRRYLAATILRSCACGCRRPCACAHALARQCDAARAPRVRPQGDRALGVRSERERGGWGA